MSRKIEREMSDIEKRLLRAQTPDFKEVRMIWLNNIWLIEDPLLYNVHDMGNVFGFEFHETEMFLLKHIKKQDFLQMLVPRRDNGPRDFYMTADGVRRMALVGFEKAEAEDRMRFFSNDWKWISRTYFKWIPQMAKRFFGGLSLLNV